MAVAGTVCYAWNPLVLLEVVGNAHNDVLVALCAALLVAAGLRRSWVAAAVAAACAVMVKPFAVLLVPAMARQIIREGRGGIPWRLLATTAAVGSAAGLALSLPLWAGAGLVSNVLDNPAGALLLQQRLGAVRVGRPRLVRDERRGAEHPYLDAVRAAVFAGGALWVLTRRASHRGLPDMAVQLWILFCVTAAWVWPGDWSRRSRSRR